MNCPNCGKESVEGAKFCESCGAPLVSEVSEPAAPVPPAPASPFNAPEPSMPVGTNTAQSSAPQAPAQTQSGYAPYEPPAQPYGTQNGYAAPNANTQQGYYTQPGPSQQNPYQNAYQAPYGQPAYQGAYDGAIYPMSDSDRTLRLINFILCLVSTITCALLIIPSRMDASHDDHQLGNLQGQEAQHHRVWRVYAPVREPYWRHLAFVLAQRPIAAAPQQSSNNPKFNLKKMARNGPFFSYAAVAPARSLAIEARRPTDTQETSKREFDSQCPSVFAAPHSDSSHRSFRRRKNAQLLAPCPLHTQQQQAH